MRDVGVVAEAMTLPDERAIAGVIERPRLIGRLESGFWQICVLRAPSGAGKTTLLRSWAVAGSGTAQRVWLTISPGVNSVTTFWTRVCEAAEREGLIEPRLGRSLIRRLARAFDPTGIAVAVLADAGAVTIVVDGYEMLGAALPDIDEAILRAVEAVPRLRMVVAARGGTGLAGAGRQLRNHVHVISAEDLALSEDEVEAVLRLRLDVVPPGVTPRLRAATHGHALAVSSAALALRHGGSLARHATHGWARLVEAELRRQLPDPRVARFVALTSVSPYLDVDLASAMTGRVDAAEILAHLEQQGFGCWTPFERHRPVFQYAGGVRDSFARELRASDAPAYRQSARLAARWLVDQGDADTAFSLAIAAEDYVLAVEVFVKRLLAHPESYPSDRLLTQLDRLPDHVLRAHPMLAFALGLARSANPVMRPIAADAFRRAIRHPMDRRLLGGSTDRFIAATVRAISLRMSGRFRGAARQAERAIEELDEVAAADRDAAGPLIAMLLRQLGYCLLQGGDLGVGVATLTRSAASAVSRAARNDALAHLVGAHGYRGDLPQLRMARSQIATSSLPHSLDETELNGMAFIGEGFMRLDARDPVGALDLVEKASSAGPQSEFWPFVSAVRLHARLMLGEGLAEARVVAEALRAPLPLPGIGDNTATRTLMSLQAIAWLSTGRLSKAECILDGQRADSPELVPARLAHALVTGRAERAAGALAGWLDLRGHSMRTRLATLLLGAAVVRRTGNERLSLSLLEQVVDVQPSYGVMTHLDLLPDDDRAALIDLAIGRGMLPVADHLRLGVDAMPAMVPVLTLTSREQVVLAALASMTSRETIAQRLSVSVNTVKSQIRSIYRKLGVATRAEALSVALEHELFDGAHLPAVKG